ncbi:MAG: gluconate 2-dehydrogenase subunit 3 family protein [Candidatus Binatia bacterium]
MQSPERVLRELIGTPMDRRRFLKGSATGLALLGLGSVLPAGCSRYPKPQVPLKFFNPREYATVNAAAERILGVSGSIGAGADRIDVAAHVDPLIADWDAEAQGQLRTMLRVFEHGTYLFDLRRKRFTALAPEHQDRYLDGWMNSTLGARRIVFRALKALAATGFYQDPRAWVRLGYDGPWLGRLDAAGRVEPQPVTPLSALRPGGA